MESTITNLIQACQWAPSYFLIVSDNVFSPLLYYSYFGAAIPSVVIGFLIYFKGKKYLENRLLLLTIMTFIVWIFCALVTWATEFPKLTMFFWTILVIVEPMVYFFAFYFSYTFIYKKDFSLIQKIIFSVPILPTLILAPTKFALLGYDLSNCDRAAIEGILASYGYTLELIYVILIIGFAIYAYRKISDKIEKRKIVLITFGITFFLLSFSLGNMLEVFTDNWYIGQYGLFGAPIFIAFLSFLIVRYRSLNIKLLGTQALVWSLIILISSQFFSPQSLSDIIITSITLIVSAWLGLMIVRSVKKEVELREKTEQLAQDLELANSRQTALIHFITHQVKGFFTKSRNIFSMMKDGDYGVMSTEMQASADEGFRSDTKAVSLVQEILNASNLKKGTVAYSMQPIDLKELVSEVAETEKPNAEKKKLVLSLVSDEKVMMIKGDSGQLRQAIRNLIDNSIRYTPSGNIWIKLTRNNGNIILDIKDTGIGISKEDMPLLFTEGGHGKNSMKVNVDSTGYGLFIVKGIIEAHGGKIKVKSDGEGKGAEFTVELKAV